MAHFYADMTGSRGQATRCGTKNSGIVAHIRGWNIGVKVLLEHDKATGKDTVTLIKTAGSHGNGHGMKSEQVTWTLE